MEIVNILESPHSTLLGMNGGCPESPDGSRIVYALKKDLKKPETEIYICDRDLKNHRKVFEVSMMNHNGPSATFVDDSTIVFRDCSQGLNCFRMLDVDTGEVKCKIFAKESHNAENGKYPFSVSDEFLEKNPKYPQIDKCGIYLMDIKTGDIERVAEDMEIIDMVREAGLTPVANTTSVSHVQLNYSATSVMMRIGVAECRTFGALGCIDLKTKKKYIIPDKPVHQLWFDNDTYMATRQFENGGRIEMETSYIARFSKDGKELEVLGGIANHMDASGDRKLFAGDRCYPGYSPDIYIYKRGDKTPATSIKMIDNQDIIWELNVHPNPSFSRDGKRLYFNMPVSGERSEACFVDISRINEK